MPHQCAHWLAMTVSATKCIRENPVRGSFRFRHCEPVTDVTGVAIRFPMQRRHTHDRHHRRGIDRKRHGRDRRAAPERAGRPRGRGPRVHPGPRRAYVAAARPPARPRCAARRAGEHPRPLPVHRVARAALLHRRGHRRAAVPRRARRAARGAGGAVRRRGAAGARGRVHQARLPQRPARPHAGRGRHRPHSRADRGAGEKRRGAARRGRHEKNRRDL